jgi:DNA-binding Lrp family transcriptional regulator
MEPIIEEQEDNRIGLKYVKMEPELFLNDILNKIDCLVFCIVELHDNAEHCFASNKYMANILGVTTTTVSTSISRLKEEGYIEELSFNGRKRIIAVKADYKERHNLLIKSLNGRVKEPLKQNTNIEDKEEKQKETVSKETDSVLAHGHQVRQAIVEEKKRNRHTEETNDTFVNTKAIIDSWNDIPSLHTHKAGTKTYTNIVTNLEKLFKGTLFNTIPEYAKYKNYKFKRSEVMEAIRRFTLAATSADHLPHDKKYLRRVGLGEFFYCEYKKYSHFLFYHENEPALCSDKKNADILAKDKYPDITKKLIEWYSKFVMKGNNGHYSVKETMDFVSASKQITEFAEKKGIKINNVEYWINMHDCSNVPELITKLTIAMFEEYINKTSKRFHTGFLASERTYSQFLIEYLKETAYI